MIILKDANGKIHVVHDSYVCGENEQELTQEEIVADETLLLPLRDIFSDVMLIHGFRIGTEPVNVSGAASDSGVSIEDTGVTLEMVPAEGEAAPVEQSKLN